MSRSVQVLNGEMLIPHDFLKIAASVWSITCADWITDTMLSDWSAPLRPICAVTYLKGEKNRSEASDKLYFYGCFLVIEAHARRNMVPAAPRPPCRHTIRSQTPINIQLERSINRASHATRRVSGGMELRHRARNVPNDES